MYHIHIHLEPGMLFSDIIRPPKQIFAWLKHIALILQKEGIWFFFKRRCSKGENPTFFQFPKNIWNKLSIVTWYVYI